MNPQAALAGVANDWALDPVLFLEEALRGRARRWQRDAATQVAARFLSGQKKVQLHVRKCHTAGGTFLQAWLFLWFMYTRYQCRGLSTAPTQKMVDKLLWAEIRSMYHQSIFADRVGKVMDSSEIRVNFLKSWTGLGFSSDKPFNLEGHHGKKAVVLAMDECKAIRDSTRNSLQPFLHVEESLFVASSTPWINDGWFYRMDAEGGDKILRVVVTIEDLIDDGVEGSVEAKEDYILLYGGVDSPEYRSRAMAEYISANPFGEIKMEALDDCMEMEPKCEGQKVASLDVARGDEGDLSHDESVVALSHGVDILDVIPFRTRDTVIASRRLSYEAREFGASLLRPDAIGIGAGPTDLLTHEGWEEDQVDEFVANTPANDPERYENRATEAAAQLCERINNRGCSMPQKIELRRQCLQVRFIPRPGGRIGLEKAPKIDGVQMRSPDQFDACSMATAMPISGKSGGLFGYLQKLKDAEVAEEKAARGE